MKINHTSKTTLLLATGAVIVGLMAGAYITYTFKLWPFADHQSQTAKQEAANASDVTNPQQKNNLPSSDSLKATGGAETTDKVPVAEAGSLQITTLEQRQGNVVFSAAITNAPAGGTCSALFEQADGAARPVTRTVQSTDNTCPETAIPEVEFVARGNWKLTLRYYIDGTQLIATKDFEVN